MLIKAVGHILQCQRNVVFPLLGNNNMLLTATEVQIWQLPGKGKETTYWQDFYLFNIMLAT